jgi:predicted metal-dependent HD superfamily phosphohydrolase
LCTRDYTEYFDLHDADAPTQRQVRDDFLAGVEHDLQAVGVVTPSATRIARRLWSALAAPPRHYHSPVHILAMLQYAERAGLQLTTAERLAVWFHDVVYDPAAPTGHNEAHSARRMRDDLDGEPIGADVLEMASQIILSTAHHTHEEAPPEHHRVLDLDLAGFTAPPDVFDRQSAALRREFAHVPEARYARQTAGFLRALLARRTIFRTEPFAPFEAQARARIEREIQRLESGSRV